MEVLLCERINDLRHSLFHLLNSLITTASELRKLAINSGVLTSLLLPHLSSSLTDSLPSLKLLCYSKTDAWFMQDAPKAVWSIPYVSVAFFPSLKQNLIAYRSSNVSSHQDCNFEIHQLWQSGFSRVYSNSCCSSSFEREIIKIGQSSHKIYSNNILNFQESLTILNACTKKSGNLLNAPRIIFMIISVKLFRFECKPLPQESKVMLIIPIRHSLFITPIVPKGKNKNEKKNSQHFENIFP